MKPPLGEWNGRRTYLRPVAVSDAGWLHELAAGPAGIRWRLAGLTANPGSLTHAIWEDAPVQVVACAQYDDSCFGLIQIFGLDHTAQRASVAVIFKEEVWNAGWPLEALVLLIDWAFVSLGLRRIYFEMPDSVVQRLGGAVGWLVEAGRLRRHVRFGGEVQDLHIFYLASDGYDRDLVERYVRAPSATTH